MPDAYSILGISPGADEQTIKKAYRQKCKQYHPDLHPDDPVAEEKFKEVQAAYSQLMKGGSSGASSQGGYGGASGPYSGYSGGGYYSSGGNGGYYRSNGYQGRQYQDPFGFSGFGFGPFGFGFGYTGGGFNQGAGPRPTGNEEPEMQAAGNYLRNGYYREGMNVLNGIPEMRRNARWHYYAAYAHMGLGNNIQAQTEARTAVSMEPNNYEYQNLLNMLQNPGAAYSAQRTQHAQPGTTFCLRMWFYMVLCNCCFGGRFFCC